MKRLYLFLLAAGYVFVINSCSKDYFTDEEYVTPYEQTKGESIDSLETKHVQNNDSIDDAVYNSQMLQSDTVPQKQEEEQWYNCNMNITGRLIVDDGTSVDLTDTRFNVSKIIVKVSVDENDSICIFEPDINSDIKEPLTCEMWEKLPQGLRYDSKPFCARPIDFQHKGRYDAEITIYSVLRTKDSNLVTGCSTIKDTCIVNYSSKSRRTQYLTLDIPIELRTIQFGATVAETETE